MLQTKPTLALKSKPSEKIVDRQTKKVSVKHYYIKSYPQEELFKELFDSASEYLPGKEGTVASLVNDHQYKANFRIDKEINTMSLINNLILQK